MLVHNLIDISWSVHRCVDAEPHQLRGPQPHLCVASATWLITYRYVGAEPRRYLFDMLCKRSHGLHFIYNHYPAADIVAIAIWSVVHNFIVMFVMMYILQSAAMVWIRPVYCALMCIASDLTMVTLRWCITFLTFVGCQYLDLELLQ